MSHLSSMNKSVTPAGTRVAPVNPEVELDDSVFAYSLSGNVGRIHLLSNSKILRYFELKKQDFESLATEHRDTLNKYYKFATFLKKGVVPEEISTFFKLTRPQQSEAELRKIGISQLKETVTEMHGLVIASEKKFAESFQDPDQWATQWISRFIGHTDWSPIYGVMPSSIQKIRSMLENQGSGKFFDFFVEQAKRHKEETIPEIRRRVMIQVHSEQCKNEKMIAEQMGKITEPTARVPSPSETEPKAIACGEDTPSIEKASSNQPTQAVDQSTSNVNSGSGQTSFSDLASTNKDELIQRRLYQVEQSMLRVHRLQSQLARAEGKGKKQSNSVAKKKNRSKKNKSSRNY